MDWFSTIRGRAGLVVDDSLIYVTGGLAAAKINDHHHRSGDNINEQISV